MTLKEFADSYRLKLSKDDCGDPVIVGKLGHLYEYSDSELGLFFMASRRTSKAWTNVCHSTSAAGMLVRQTGDDEGCLSFDPTNQEQANLAIKAIHAQARRKTTPERLRVLARFYFRRRPTDA
jgi:hypothetical protein